MLQDPKNYIDVDNRGPFVVIEGEVLFECGCTVKPVAGLGPGYHWSGKLCGNHQWPPALV